MAISATQLTIFLYFFAIFLDSTGQIFSQIPQALFTELIGLALLFSLFPSIQRRGWKESRWARSVRPRPRLQALRLERQRLDHLCDRIADCVADLQLLRTAVKVVHSLLRILCTAAELLHEPPDRLSLPLLPSFHTRVPPGKGERSSICNHSAQIFGTIRRPCGQHATS
jgi:hypothetical protein